MWTYVIIACVAMLSVSLPVQAQSLPWSAEVGIGWDNSISGNINSSAIGTLNNQAVVVTKNSYEDVYGTGLHLRFGGGYMINESVEVRAAFSFQSLDADLTSLGDIGVSRLYGQYTDYQAFVLDVGVRQYHPVASWLRLYGEGTIGLGFVDKTDVTIVAPSINFSRKNTDFYDQTTALALGTNAGVLVTTGERVGIFAQLGLRWVSGMTEIDDLAGTGLEPVNDASSRWTIPFIGGVRVRF